MSDAYPEASDQIQSAYEIMAGEVNYFPYSDPNLSLGERDLPEERYRYEKRWWEEETNGAYVIGAPSQEHRPALIYAVEAARNITSWDPQKAKRLLQLAIREIDNAAPLDASEVPDYNPENLTFTTHLHEPAHGGPSGRLERDDITAVKVNPDMTVQDLVNKVFDNSGWGFTPDYQAKKSLVIRPEKDISQDKSPWG